MKGRHALIVLSSFVAACGPDAGGKAGQVVASVSIDTVPLVDLPATTKDGEMRYGNADDVLRLDNGTIVLVDRASFSIRFLSPDGALLREAGRKGTGPFEFQMPHGVRRCGVNALFIWDPWQDRITVFDTLGNGLRQFALSGNPSIWSCNDRGNIAAVTAVQGYAFPSVTAPDLTGEISIFREDGTTFHSFERQRVGVNRPLGAVLALTIRGDFLYVSNADSASVIVTTLKGQATDTVSLGVSGRPVSAAQYAGTVDHSLLGLVLAKDRDELRPQLLKIPPPEHLPALRGLLADPTGAVWAIVSPFGDGATVLQGVDSTGRPLGTIRIPIDFDVREIGRDYLIGIAEDSQGEQHVLVYKLTRR